jgi:predicted O-methyltransferase YrrM
MSVLSIRPWKLFALVEDQLAERLSFIKIPIRRHQQHSDYSLRLLELMTLTACIRITKAKRMFEFGTFLGNTTLHMATNSDPEAHIWTLDADDETLKRIGLLDIYRWREQFPLEFEGMLECGKITRLRGDSHIFQPEEKNMDLVLVDADHSGKGVAIDMENALKMLNYKGCILWHDYSNPLCLENTLFLDRLSQSMRLFHIADTMLAVHFVDESIARRIIAL